MDSLIKKFNLEEKVKNFVSCEVEKLVTKNQLFSFSGSCSHCGNSETHIPHVIEMYSTVRFGTLDKYCLGVEGDEFRIVYRTLRGDAETPSVSSGFWCKVN